MIQANIKFGIPAVSGIAAAATTDIEATALNATLVALVVGVVYWLMKVVDRLLSKRNGKESPLDVLIDIRALLRDNHSKIKDMYDWFDMSHSEESTYQNYVKDTRRLMSSLGREQEKILTQLHNQSRQISRVRGEIRNFESSACPLKADKVRRFLVERGFSDTENSD